MAESSGEIQHLPCPLALVPLDVMNSSKRLLSKDLSVFGGE